MSAPTTQVPARLQRALESQQDWGRAGVHLVPIRHHSPACALALSALLEEVRPTAVLIEGPAEYTALLSALQDPATIPPANITGPARLDDRRDYPPGSAYQLSLVLIGRARHYLPLISYAWQQAFKTADGVARGQAELTAIAIEHKDHWEEIYDGTRIAEHDNHITLPDSVPDRVTLHISTPLRLQHNGVALGVERLDAQTLLTQLQRRLSLTAQIHLGITPEADYSALKTQAAQVESHKNLRWYDWQRYSNRQQRHMHLGGVIGEWTLAGLAPEHARALQIEQWLHLGKNTTFGLGRYTLTEHTP